MRPASRRRPAPPLIPSTYHQLQFDATTDGRPIKIVSIVDEHTRAVQVHFRRWRLLPGADRGGTRVRAAVGNYLLHEVAEDLLGYDAHAQLPRSLCLA